VLKVLNEHIFLSQILTLLKLTTTQCAKIFCVG